MSDRETQPMVSESRQETPDEETTASNLSSAALEPLLGANEADQFRGRWQAIQGTFVDEPKSSVNEADALVTELMGQLTDTFQKERQSLEAQLDSDEVSTEDLRVALQRYRSFFERLLTT
jgi:hypothetical protein